MLFSVSHALNDLGLARLQERPHLVQLEALHVSAELRQKLLTLGQGACELPILGLEILNSHCAVEGILELATLVVGSKRRLRTLAGGRQCLAALARLAEDRVLPTSKPAESRRIPGETLERRQLTALLIAGVEALASLGWMTEGSLERSIEVSARIRKCVERGFELVDVAGMRQLSARVSEGSRLGAQAIDAAQVLESPMDSLLRGGSRHGGQPAKTTRDGIDAPSGDIRVTGRFKQIDPTCEILTRSGRRSGDSYPRIRGLELFSQVEDLLFKAVDPGALRFRRTDRIVRQLGATSQVVGKVVIGQPPACGSDLGLRRVRPELACDGLNARLELL